MERQFAEAHPSADANAVTASFDAINSEISTALAVSPRLQSNADTATPTTSLIHSESITALAHQHSKRNILLIITAK